MYDKSIVLVQYYVHLAKIAVVGPLGPLLHLDIGPWPNNGARQWASSCREKRKCKQRVVGYSQYVLATLAPVEMFCQAIHYCSSQCSQLSRTEGYFSPLVSSITASRTMKDNE